LAARLETSPGDIDGWMRLGRARSVLGQPEAAADAYERAAALRPWDVSVPLRAVEALLAGLKPVDPIPERAAAILRRVEAIRPDEPAALWYLGLVAARDGRRDAARDYWRRLQAGMDPRDPDADLVKQALEALGR
jgi:cytochrome c-type biogenesis protein CcmH